MSINDHDSTVIQIWENEGGALGPEADRFPSSPSVARTAAEDTDTPGILRFPSFGHPRPAKRVLVVENDPDTRWSYGVLLGLWHYDSCLAEDGPAALALAPAFRPDVVLMDVGLPGMDGCEVARRLRQTPACASAPLVAISGWPQPAIRRRARAAGLWPYLLKPADPDFLRNLLDHLTSDHNRAA